MARGIVRGGKNDGGGSNIKSVQRGTATTDATTSKDITISSVDVNNSIVILSADGAGSTIADWLPRASLTNGTTLNIAKYNGSTSKTINWQVVEFQNVKSLQKGTLSASEASTVTISSVDTAKSILFFTFSVNGGSSALFGCAIPGKIASSTSLSFDIWIASIVNWYVVEFN